MPNKERTGKETRMLYETLLSIGAIGLLAQTVLGMAGHGLHGGNSGDGIDLEMPQGHLGHAGHADSGGHHNAPADAGHGPSVPQHKGTALWTLFSPLTIFSLCLGAGATGILARYYILFPLPVAVAAVIGGILFYVGIVKPLWRLIFKFASKPAETLSGAVAREATATGRFNADGQGIVQITVDGEFVRLLARLESEDRKKGITVLAGDKLVVTSVDEKRNTCCVTRL